LAIPEQIDAIDLADYLEVMTKAVFQAGLNWKMIENKWPAFRKAFADFDVVKVAKFRQEDIERLTNDQSILRSANKIAATVKNAQVLIELDREFDGFAQYLRSKSSYEELRKDLRKRFKYMGDLNVYYFLFRVKEPVPPFEEWVKTIPGDHPRMREMVQLAAAKNEKAIEKSSGKQKA
jgi:3-methyladenine DNA glycosylase Tag